MKKLVLIALLIVGAHAQKQFGLDIPLSFTKSLNSVPNALPFESEGGSGSDLGIGVFFQISELLNIKAGYHTWDKVMNPTVEGRVFIENQSLDIIVKEHGKISYSGLYVRANLTPDPFVFGAGLDISLSESYSASASIYNTNNQLLGKSDELDYSTITKKFNNQVDLILSAGIRIPINENFNIIPTSQLSAPTLPIYDSNIRSYNPVDNTNSEALFLIFVFKFGINIEITF